MAGGGLAVIADVHGNRLALEAVLADIAGQGVTDIINLGDVLYGAVDPAGTADLLMQMNIPTVCGNGDRMLVDGSAVLNDTWKYTLSQLTDKHLKWVRSFRKTFSEGSILAFHASPVSDSSYLLWEVRRGSLVRREPSSIAETLSPFGASLVLCGHDHVQYTTDLGGGAVLVNPGSVGLPAYQDDLPVEHSMVSGSPHARYSIVRDGGASIEHRAVEYDWHAAAAIALANGRPDWARWLVTGDADLT